MTGLAQFPVGASSIRMPDDCAMGNDFSCVSHDRRCKLLSVIDKTANQSCPRYSGAADPENSRVGTYARVGSCSVTRRFRRPNAILALGRIWSMRQMMQSD